MTSTDYYTPKSLKSRGEHLKKHPPELLCKKRCSSKFRKFYRKTTVFKSLFNKVAGSQACNFFKRRLQRRCFPVKFVKFLRTSTLKNICERLLLLWNNTSTILASAYAVVATHQVLNVSYSFCPIIVTCKVINKRNKSFIEFCFTFMIFLLRTSFCTSPMWTSSIFCNSVRRNPCNLITSASISDA